MAEVMGDLHALDSDLRNIRVDDGPRLQPLRLEQMFSRAEAYGRKRQAARSAPIVRPSSPPRRAAVIALPLPLAEGQAVSPLGGLFDYPELLPYVLKNFERPQELATLARVNKAFCQYVRRRLYATVWVRPWEDNCSAKLKLLFESLRRNTELCKLVKSLDVRFFPLSTRDTERYELDEKIQCSMEGMSNLQHLVWTRDKSLNPTLVERIASLRHLRSLELSGHSYRYYDPKLLGHLPALDDLRVMMPDSNFKSALVDIIQELDQRPIGGLRGLALVCRSSPLVDDAILKVVARHLRSLQRLTLWGCIRVTRSGVFELLKEAEELEEISLDALPHSGLLDLSCSPTLPRLETLSLAFSAPHKKTAAPLQMTVADLPKFPYAPNLSSLLLTLSGDRAFMPPGGLAHLQEQVNFAALRRLSLLHLYIGSAILSDMLQSAPYLEELYISVNGRQAIVDCPELRSSRLKILHVNAPERWGPTGEDLTGLAVDMRYLEQIGQGNRVYEVVRRLDGEEESVELVRWSRTTTPGYFQIWRG